MTHTVDNKKINEAVFTVVPDGTMPDYHNDPTVIAAVERARAFLEKAGLPKGWGPKTTNNSTPPQPE